ncbi:MAG: glutathione ABC transporter substrate-binding protein [Turicibacter sp.]|nr:glutathione ABC transporter substrate-binding protein [Turicibacter sp.]
MIKKHLLKMFPLAVIAVLAACGTSEGNGTGTNPANTEETAIQEDRTLTIANNADPVSLDPQLVNEGASALINTQIYETLVSRDVDMNIIPGLATDWEQIDELTWEFHLRQGVYFHNGEPFTAKDVEFTLSRALESPVAAAILGMIDPDGFEVVDEHTIRISTLEPFAPLLANLGHSTSFIVSRAAVEEAGSSEAFAEHPIGTGPFKFISRTRGENIVLERFEGYHGETPQIAGIVYRIIPEATSRLFSLENGEVDIAFGVAPSDARRIEQDENLTLLSRQNTAVSYIGFNNQMAPFDDVRVRQAFNYAVDLEGIIASLLEGFGEPALGPLASTLPMASIDVEVYGFDQERARELLAEAGIEEGFEVTIWTDQSETNRNIVTAVANQLGQVGINVSIEQFEWAAYISALDEGNHQMFIMGWTPVTGDADNALFPLFHSSQWGAPGNRSLFANDEVDALIEEARTTFDESRRAELYHQLQELLIEEAPWVFLHNGTTLHATRSDVHGYVPRLNGQQDLSGVYFR